jgi:UDP-N-acetylglucosamine diphosphorylase/glucosamine-1-phosphate N-acetyltransferase
LLIVNQLYDIFGLNLQAILADYARLDLSHSQELSDSCHVIGPREDADGRSLIYIAPGARVEGAFINTTNGPVYIGENAEVMEGSCLRGPVAICRNATVNMATKIYPATTIGPWCKVGGELNNVVIFGYSNKAHDGFLGNAVIGEWCNLGAGCVASNLKNDYSRVRLWNYPTQRFLKTDLQFCGLIMGDHSKAGINTMFNTATVVGVGCNVYGAGFLRTFIPSFSEGGAAGFSTVPLKKFFDIAERVMARRGRQLTDADRAIFETLYHAQ